MILNWRIIAGKNRLLWSSINFIFIVNIGWFEWKMSAKNHRYNFPLSPLCDVKFVFLAQFSHFRPNNVSNSVTLSMEILQCYMSAQSERRKRSQIFQTVLFLPSHNMRSKLEFIWCITRCAFESHFKPYCVCIS